MAVGVRPAAERADMTIELNRSVGLRFRQPP
jgi:hypothetical protein